MPLIKLEQKLNDNYVLLNDDLKELKKIEATHGFEPGYNLF